jgi:hypothetical protein
VPIPYAARRPAIRARIAKPIPFVGVPIPYAARRPAIRTRIAKPIPSVGVPILGSLRFHYITSARKIISLPCYA